MQVVLELSKQRFVVRDTQQPTNLAGVMVVVYGKSTAHSTRATSRERTRSRLKGQQTFVLSGLKAVHPLDTLLRRLSSLSLRVSAVMRRTPPRTRSTVVRRSRSARLFDERQRGTVDAHVLAHAASSSLRAVNIAFSESFQTLAATALW